MSERRWEPRILKGGKLDKEAALALAKAKYADAMASVEATQAEFDRIDADFREIVDQEAARQLSFWDARGISDIDDDEFTGRITALINGVRLRAIRSEGQIPTLPLSTGQPIINLFGYGSVPAVLLGYDDSAEDVSKFSVQDSWFWGHEAALALGWDLAKFDEWAHVQQSFDLRQQRYNDEESGVLGWGSLHHFPVGVSVWGGEGSCNDHSDERGVMSGPIMRYWVDLWLISGDRIMSMLSSSPWSKEFMDGVTPLMAHAMTAVAPDLPTVTVGPDGGVEPGPSMREWFTQDTQGLTEEEARERAFRGPVAPTEKDGA